MPGLFLCVRNNIKPYTIFSARKRHRVLELEKGRKGSGDRLFLKTLEIFMTQHFQNSLDGSMCSKA